ncbi:hypothetical protein MRX96_055028 [Rhipicephalus microplus]
MRFRRSYHDLRPDPWRPPGDDWDSGRRAPGEGDALRAAPNSLNGLSEHERGALGTAMAQRCTVGSPPSLLSRLSDRDNTAAFTVTARAPLEKRAFLQQLSRCSIALYHKRVYSDGKADKSSKGSKSGQSDMSVDQAVLDKLEAGFKKLQDAKDCKSLLKKYLTKEIFDKLKTRKTAMGATLLDVIQSGVENLDSGDYHGGFKPTDKHPPTDFGDLSTLVNVDPDNKYVVSTRVRCGRSLQGYPFNPCLIEPQYKEMEEKVSSALRGLTGELKGTYYPSDGHGQEDAAAAHR